MNELKELLDALVLGIKGVLDDNLVGVYLRGSLALGDFNPETSDIDFLVVTERTVSEQEFTALAIMHAQLAASSYPFADRLEGSYMPRSAVRHFGPEERRHPSIGVDWEFGWGLHRENAILELWIVREHGVVLYGPDPKTLIDPISTERIREAVRGELAVRIEDWATKPEAPEWLLPRYYQAFEVETMCRALYTLTYGELCSKPHAVAWALKALPELWNALIQHHQFWRANKDHDPSTVKDVQRFVCWAATEGETFVLSIPDANGQDKC